SVHLFRIDKRQPSKTIQQSFNRWLINELKGDSNPIARSGRRPTARLVGFAGIRLMDDFRLSKAEALSWLKQWFGARVPSTLERFERDITVVRDRLRDFLPAPAEIGV